MRDRVAANSAHRGPVALLDPHWDGRPGRLEVWYATFTDEVTGDGLWLHHEVVAPTIDRSDRPGTTGSGGGRGLSHDVAWAAVFPGPVARRAPRWAHAEQVHLTPTGSRGSTTGVVHGDAERNHATVDGPAEGSTGTITWDLTWDVTGAEPLYTFPRWAWERHLLPAAQIVVAPDLVARGTVDGRPFNGRGALSRIYGHGNAERWGWLHVDLGDGDVLELVTAVSTRPGLRLLPPITHLRYRIDGVTGPSFQGPSFRLHTRLGLPTWTVSGRIGRDEVSIRVHQPTERCVAIPYADPDGRPATCTNSEIADVEIRIGGRRWDISGRAHAEVGLRR